MIVTYDGGIDAVDVKLPSRWLLNIGRGDTVEVTEDEAQALLTIPGWTPGPDPTPTSPEDES